MILELLWFSGSILSLHGNTTFKKITWIVFFFVFNWNSMESTVFLKIAYIWTLSGIASYGTLLTGTFFMEQTILGSKPSLSIFLIQIPLLWKCHWLPGFGSAHASIVSVTFFIRNKMGVSGMGRQGVRVLWFLF